MEPTGRREAPPDDRLREIRDSRDAGPGLRFAPSRLQRRDLPVGGLSTGLSSLFFRIFEKYLLPPDPNQIWNSRHPTPPEGRIMIVTDAGEGCGGRSSVGRAMRAQGGLLSVSG